MVKANKRAKLLMAKHLLYSSPVRIDVNMVSPSPMNRGGLPLNIVYVHQDLCANIMKDGYDVDRPHVGIVIRRESEVQLKRLRDHATRMREGSDLHPPCVTNMLTYECLAGNHLTTALQLFKAQKKSSISGMIFKSDDDKELQLELQEGKQFWVLKDTITDEEADFLSGGKALTKTRTRPSQKPR